MSRVISSSKLTVDFRVRRHPGWSKTELVMDKPTPVSISDVIALLDLKDGDTMRIEKVPKGKERKPGLGWACPRCGRVYAPPVLECPRCNGGKP